MNARTPSPHRDDTKFSPTSSNIVNLARIRRKFANHHIGSSSKEYKITYVNYGEVVSVKSPLYCVCSFYGPNDLIDRQKHGWGCKTFTTLSSLRSQYPSTECTAAVLDTRENNIMFIIIMIVVIMFHIINTVYNALWEYNAYLYRHPLYGVIHLTYHVLTESKNPKGFKNCSFTSTNSFLNNIFIITILS